MSETYFTPINPPELPKIEEGYLPENVFVRFAFSKHEGRDDFDTAAAVVSISDIVIPEAEGWEPEHLKWFRDVSRSKKPENFQKLIRHRIARKMGVQEDGFARRLTESIRGTSKSIVLIDAPHGAEITNPNRLVSLKNSVSQEGALRYFYRSCVMAAEGSAQREKIIVESLGPFVTQAVAEHPRLREQSTVDVAVILGLAHERVYWHLQESPYTKEQVAASVARAAGSHNDDYPQDKIILNLIRSNKPVERAILLDYIESARLKPSAS